MSITVIQFIASTEWSATRTVRMATWQLFARLAPPRTDPFSARMNGAAKLVASQTLKDASASSNSTVPVGPLLYAGSRRAS